MPTAFVLINTEIGAEEEVVNELKKIPYIKEAHVVYGVYDIVAKVEYRGKSGGGLHGEVKRGCFMEH